jgi:uncharacterized spore protein YtfJ
MDQIKRLLTGMSKSLDRLAEGNAVVANPISVGDRHVVPLCELSLAYGGGGGVGEGESPGSKKGAGSGEGGGGGGAAKASPVAVLVVEDGKIRLEKIGN